MLSASIIVPTYNRPDELEVTLESILYQTRKPNEVIIIDDGNLPVSPLRYEFEAADIKYTYRQKNKPGLTESRNLGVSLTTGDIILFLDDDVKLFKDYIETILDVYEDDTKKEIGGVGALIVNHKPLTLARRIRHLYDRLFLISGKIEGIALPSGFCTNYGATSHPPTHLMAVDFLSGAACSYRAGVFDQLGFTDRYRDFGFGEDKDFSIQVAERYRLLLQPKARLYHFESPLMRPDLYNTGRKFILGRYLFFRVHSYRGWWSWILFGYAMTGYIASRFFITLLSCRRKEWRRMLGIASALKDIFKGDTLLNDATLVGK